MRFKRASTVFMSKPPSSRAFGQGCKPLRLSRRPVAPARFPETSFCESLQRFSSNRILFDAFSYALADGITRFACRTSPDGGAPVRNVLRDMRRHVSPATLRDEVSRIIAFVGRERDAFRAGQGLVQRIVVAASVGAVRLAHVPESSPSGGSLGADADSFCKFAHQPRTGHQQGGQSTSAQDDARNRLVLASIPFFKCHASGAASKHRSASSRAGSCRRSCRARPRQR